MQDILKEVPSRQAILLTGGSGFLGRYLAAEFLQQGKAIFFLVNPRLNEDSQTRIFEILKTVGVHQDFFSRVFVVEGDVTKPLCGVAEEWIQEYEGMIEMLFHAAGAVRFRGKATLTQVNREGTNNAIKLARALRAPLHYVSTAYVSGNSRERIIGEDKLLLNARFRNEYEKSKYEAESLVRNAAHTGFITSTIYRPSILIGHSKTGQAFTFSGYYVPLFYFYHLRHSWLLRQWSKAIKFPMFYVKGATINFIPVDCAARFIAKISRDARAKNKTFHIVHPYPASVRFMLQTTLELLHYPPLFFFALPKTFVQILRKILHWSAHLFGRHGKKFQVHLCDYIDYFTDDHEFSLNNTRELLGEEVDSVPPITKEFVTKCARYALEIKGLSY